MSMLQVTPDELRAAAGRLNGLAEQIGQLEGATRATVDQINWTGTTHQSIITGQVNSIAGVIREAQGQLHQAAGGLMAYAAKVDDMR
jgi:hypothetical protein